MADQFLNDRHELFLRRALKQIVDIQGPTGAKRCKSHLNSAYLAIVALVQDEIYSTAEHLHPRELLVNQPKWSHYVRLRLDLIPASIGAYRPGKHGGFFFGYKAYVDELRALYDTASAAGRRASGRILQEPAAWGPKGWTKGVKYDPKFAGKAGREAFPDGFVLNSHWEE
jgi:hypothetical protein